MTVDLENEASEELGIDCGSLACEVARQVLMMEACPYEAQVNVVLTSEEEIQKVNLEFREINAPTDVLSFPMIPFESPGDYQLLEEDDSYMDLDTGELMLGDIMISVPRVIKQAQEYGHSIKREYCFLIAHSMLHLLGYDHMTTEEAAVMEQKQEAALQALSITR
ncbi:MAG: rRNA maturation RNase YbeY [Blautia sp.]|jgi:probable rRNA maturation factor